MKAFEPASRRPPARPTRSAATSSRASPARTPRRSPSSSATRGRRASRPRSRATRSASPARSATTCRPSSPCSRAPTSTSPFSSSTTAELPSDRLTCRRAVHQHGPGADPKDRSNHASRRAGDHRFRQLAATADSTDQRHPAGRPRGAVPHDRDRRFADHPQQMGGAGEIHLEHRRSSHTHSVQPGLSDLRRRDSGVAVRDPDRPVLSRQFKLLGAYAAAAFISLLALSISGNGIAAPKWHFDLSDRLDDGLVAVPRRPALDRDARRGAHGVGPVAAGAVAAVVVDAAAGVRADPPRRQRGGAGPLVAGAGGGLVRRRLVVLVVGTPASGGAARGRRPRDGPARIFRGRAAGWCGRPGTGPLELAATTPRPDSVAIVEMYGPNQRSGGTLRQLWRGCDSATPKPRRCRPPCAAPSSIAR